MAPHLVRDWRILLPRFMNQTPTVTLHPLPPGAKPGTTPLEKEAIAASSIRSGRPNALTLRDISQWNNLRTYLLLAGTMALLLLKWLGILASGVTAADQLFPDCSTGPLAKNTVCNTSATVADRAKALVAELTTDEKFKLVVNTSPGVPRLGLPSYQWWQEALHGVANSPGVTFAASGNFSHATSFPAPILMGASFDDDLIEAVATVTSTEARAFSNANRSGLDFWTPNINPYRDPRWGRGMETPGEDPFHLKSYVRSLIRGLQGGDNPDMLKLVATCKHFVAYDIEDWMGNERYGFDAIVSPQDLSGYYMQPFQQCARDSKVGSIMCSYNALNGVPTCADPYILQDILRDHWNWTGDGQYVVSDCDAIQNVYMPHNFKATREEAVASTLTAGTDLDCGTYYQLHLPSAHAQGLFDTAVIDQALVRLYSALVRLGYFDPAGATPYRSLGWSDVSTPAAEALALRAAEEGIVLLKNDGGLLPLTAPPPSPSGHNLTLALIGPWADATTDMQANYAGVAPYLHSPLWAAQHTPGITALYGGVPGDPTTDGYPAALDAAGRADVVLYLDGPTTATESEGRDRTTVRWPGERLDILTQLASLGKPVVVVQMGDQLDNAPLLAHPNISAMLWAGYPGQAGGDALLRVLLGRAAPAGRLPVTQYPAAYVNAVPMTDMALRPDPSTGNPGRTYMWFDNATVEFGFGMHYTSFAVAARGPAGGGGGGGNTGRAAWDVQTLVGGYDGIVPYLDLCPFVSVDVDVTNTGTRPSDFVALGFIAGDYGPAPHPRKQLVAYQRLFNITTGSTVTAVLNLTLGSLGRHDEMGNLVLYPGSYSLLVDVPTQATWNFTLTGSPAMLDKWPQAPASSR